MRKITIVLADANTELRDILASAIAEYPQFQLIGASGAGMETLKLLQEQQPDLLVIDPLLPEIDGIEIFRRLSPQQRRSIHSIFTTAFWSQQFLSAASRLGVDSILMKPCSVDALLQRIIEIAQVCEDAALYPEAAVVAVLRDLNVPVQLQGYQFLKYGTFLMLQDPAMHAVTKQLYPAIAREFSSTPQRVERAIRHAVTHAWNACDPAERSRYFGNRETRPSNSAFFATICEYLRLHRGE